MLAGHDALWHSYCKGANMLLEKLGGRKFVLALITLVIGTIVQIQSPHGVTESFVALLVGITAAFGASNAFVSSKAISAESSEQQPAAPEVDLSVIEGKISEIESRVAEVDIRANQVADGLVRVAENVETVGKVARAALSVSKQNG